MLVYASIEHRGNRFVSTLWFVSGMGVLRGPEENCIRFKTCGHLVRTGPQIAPAGWKCEYAGHLESRVGGRKIRDWKIERGC